VAEAARKKDKIQMKPQALRAIRSLGGKNEQTFDRLIHERMRLGLISALAVNDSLTFNELKEILNTTDGNLSVHARKLEQAGYIQCLKYFDERTPRTLYRIEEKGHKALNRYLDHMEILVKAIR